MIPHSKPTLSQEEERALIEVIRSGHIAQGAQVAEFERSLAEYVGAPYAVATSSGTAALHLGLCALDVGPDDEVAMPSYVCASLLHAASYVGASPLLVDIDEHTFNLDVGDLGRKITPRTRAVILPHVFGLPAEVEDVASFGVPIIEDCAMAIGARYRTRPVGGVTDLAIFSFYATKMLCCGEGGMVVTHSKALADKVRDLREYDHKSEHRLRFNYKMTDMGAAMGRVQLKQLDRFIARRQAIADQYTAAFQSLNLLLPTCPPDRTHAFFRYVVRTDNRLNQVMADFEEYGIQVRRPVFRPLHHMLQGKASAFPGTETAFGTALSIPIYPLLNDNEVAYIIQTAGEIL